MSAPSNPLPSRVVHIVNSPVRRTLQPLSILALTALAGCAAVPTGPAAPQANAPVTAKVADQGAPVLTYNPDSGLNADVLYAVLLAEIAGHRGNLEVAADNYIALARAIPDKRVAERAAKIAVFAHKDELALEAARRWVDLDNTNPEARQVLAAMLIRAGQSDQALSHLQAALSLEAGNPSQRMWSIANVLSHEPDRQAALDVMERLVAGHERTPDMLFAYALLAIRAEKMDKARAAMEQVIDLGSANVGVAVAYVGVLQKQGETAAAIQWLETFLGRHPEQNDVRLIYARTLADAKRYEDAHAQFALLEETQPQNADVQYALGLLELQLNQVDPAKRHFEKLIELGEHAEEARFYLGQLAEINQEFQKAQQWYAQVKEGENAFEAQLRVALMMARQDRLAEASSHLHGIDVESDEQRNRIVRAEGEILAEAGRYQEAMALYDQALAGRHDAELLYTRAMLAEKMGRIDVLERDLRQILEQDPHNAQALNALGYTLADRTDRYQEAYELIKKALDLSPDDFYILDSMGWVLYRLGRLDEAIDYLKRARELRDDPEVAAHLAEVLWVKGEKQAARDVWERALKTSPGDKKLLKVIERFGP